MNQADRFIRNLLNSIHKVFYKSISNSFFYFNNLLTIYLQNVQYQSFPSMRGLIEIDNKGNLKLGHKVILNSGVTRIAKSKRTHLIIMPNAEIQIGDESGISNTTICATNKVEIGNKVYIGSGCEIFDTDFHSLDLDIRLTRAGDQAHQFSKPIKICDGAFIGAHVLILKGVTIGENSVIGAGSVVTKDIPANEIWAGNPAKFIKRLQSNCQDKQLLSISQFQSLKTGQSK